MIDQLHSELLKIRTTRTTATVLLAAIGLTLLGVIIEGSSSTLAKLATDDQQRKMFGAGNASFFATIAGIIAVTSEFRYGTIHATLVFQPRRTRVLLAKLATGAMVGIVFGAVCVGLSFGVSRAVLAVRDVPMALTGGETIALLLGTVATTALGGMLGVAIGALIRDQVGAIVAVVAYAFLVDALLFSAVPAVGRYLPGKAGDALAGQSVEHLLAPRVGAAVLIAWTLALIVAAIARTERTDI